MITATPTPAGPSPQGGRITVIVVAIIAVTVIIVAALFTLRPASSAEPAPTVTVTVTGQPDNNQASDVPVPAVIPPNATTDRGGIVANPGVADSAPVLMIFEDYQCPWCHIFEQQFGDTIRQYAEAGKIRLEYRTMNFLDQNLGNDSSTRAAIGATCADFAGVYAGYHDLVFANQPEKEGTGYTDDLLRQTIPNQLGLSGNSLASFQSCYDSRETLDFVNYTNYLAGQAGVSGTPTYALDGQKLNLDPNDPDSLKQAFQAAGI